MAAACCKRALTLLAGCFRFLFFVIALSKLSESVHSLSPFELHHGFLSGTARGVLMRIWFSCYTVVEVGATLVAMLDTIVANDGPLGGPVGKTFLSIFKVPVPIFRGFIWIITLSIEERWVNEHLVLPQGSQAHTAIQYLKIVYGIVTALAMAVCIVLILINAIRLRSHLFDRKQNMVVSPWKWTRYYEDDDFEDKRQRKKHYVEKVILIVITVLALGSNIFKILLRFKVIRSDVIVDDSAYNISSTNWDTPPNHVLNTEMADKPFLKVFTVLAYLSGCKPLAVQLTISLFLIYYISSLMCSKSFNPVHSMFKVLLVYNVISAVPSRSTVQIFLSSGNRYLISEVSQSKMSDITLWVVACLPFILVVPVIPYVCTRSIYILVKEIKQFFNDLLSLFINVFLKKGNISRLAHAVSVLLGVTSFVAIILASLFPWFELTFQPVEKLKDLIDTHKTVLETVKKVDGVFINFDCLSFNTNNNGLDGLRTEYPECFDVSSTGYQSSSCQNIRSAYNDHSANVARVTTNCKPFNDTIIVKVMSTTAYGLLLTPFTAKAGGQLLRAARIMHKTNAVMTRFQRNSAAIRKLLKILNTLDKSYGTPLKTIQLAFELDLVFLLLLLPAFVVGLLAVNVGFWRREAVTNIFNLTQISSVSLILLVLNAAVMAAVWAITYFTLLLSDMIPLIGVNVELLIGWQMLRVATTCATSACLLLFLFSSAKTLRYLLCCCHQGQKKDEQGEMEEDKESVDSSDNMLLTTTWILSLVPTAAAAVCIVLAYNSGHQGIVLTPQLEGNFGRVLTKVSESIKKVESAARGMQYEAQPTDLAYGTILTVVKPLLDALSERIISLILDYVINTENVFIFIGTAFSNLRLFFLVPVTLALGFFIIAFTLTICSCACPNISKRVINHFLFWFITLLYYVLSFNFYTVRVITYVVEQFPLFDIDVHTDSLIIYSIATIMLLAIAYGQVWIGIKKPMKQFSADSLPV